MRLLTLPLLATLSACSSSTTVGYGVSDAGNTGGGSSLSDSSASGGFVGTGGSVQLDATLTDSGTCTTLENVAPEISETVVAGAQPTPQGGTVEPGVYFETSFVRYDSKAIAADAGIAAVHRLTAQIAPDLTMMATARSLDTGLDTRYFFRLEPQPGGKLRYTFVCPTGLGFTDYGYDAAPGTLTIYYTDKWGPFGYVMTKQ